MRAGSYEQARALDPGLFLVPGPCIFYIISIWDRLGFSFVKLELVLGHCLELVFTL